MFFRRPTIRNWLRWASLAVLFAAAVHGQVLAQDGSYTFEQPSRFKDLMELVDAIVGYVFNVSVPIGFAAIIYAGVRFLIARGNPEEVSKAKAILKYSVIGLAIVFIGKGFVTLIADVLGTQAPQ